MASDNRASAAADGVPQLAVRRTVLREEVKNVLLDRILSGFYGPGERLVELRIAQELGVSQAPVREALRDLESVRLVESIPFRGSRVREASEAELVEVYPIRGALEEVAAREAAKRMNGDVAALEAELDAMAQARDLREQVEHDVRFHQLIVEASGNARLIEIWKSLQVDTRTAITAVRTGLSAHEVAEMHRPIIEAIRTRDSRAAGRTIRSHLEHFGQMVAKAHKARG